MKDVHVLQALLERTARRPLLALATDGRVLWASAAAVALWPHIRGRRPGRGTLLEAVTDLAGLALRARDDVPARSISLDVGVGAPWRAELSWMPVRRPFVIVEIDCPEPVKVPRDLALRHGLTAAETGVLDCLAAGLSNRQIGERLFISPATVRTHLYNMFRKLGVRSRVQAALLVRH